MFDTVSCNDHMMAKETSVQGVYDIMFGLLPQQEAKQRKDGFLVVVHSTDARKTPKRFSRLRCEG